MVLLIDLLRRNFIRSMNQRSATHTFRNIKFPDSIKLIPFQDIAAILKKDKLFGKPILRAPKNKALSPSNCEKVTQILVKYLLNKFIFVKRKEFEDLLNKILRVFPKENPVSKILEILYNYKFRFSTDTIILILIFIS